MNRLEIIKENEDRIIDEMIDCYRAVLSDYGRSKYKIYIWDDGEIAYLLDTSGGHMRLEPNNKESRELFYVCTVSYPDIFDPLNFAIDIPDDEDGREVLETEVIDWLVDEYKENVRNELYEGLE